MATHSSVLAWRIPGMEAPGRLTSMESDTTEVTQEQQQQQSNIQTVRHFDNFPKSNSKWNLLDLRITWRFPRKTLENLRRFVSHMVKCYLIRFV